MDATTQAQLPQLRVIRRVVDVLSAVDVPAWLFGGWGLDARIGRITRNHGDIEFWVRRSDAARSKTALLDAGSTELATQPPEEACEFIWDGVTFSTAYNQTITASGGTGTENTKPGVTLFPWSATSPSGTVKLPWGRMRQTITAGPLLPKGCAKPFSERIPHRRHRDNLGRRLLECSLPADQLQLQRLDRIPSRGRFQ